MKRILNITLLILMVSSVLVGCKKESLEYKGPVLVHFTKSSGTFFVESDSEDGYKIQLGLTKPADQDLTFTIEIEVSDSNAVEGEQFTIESKEVTIKAGEPVADIIVHSDYESLEEAFVVKFTLGTNSDYNAQFTQEFNLTIRQFCPFNVEDFVGTYLFYDEWFNGAILEGEPPYEVDAIIDEEVPNSIILLDPYDEGYSIRITFNDSDKSNFKVSIKDQPAWFNPNYGDIYLADNEGTFDACEKTISFTTTHLVPGLGYFIDNDLVTLTLLQ